jgi:hypothetical protein
MLLKISLENKVLMLVFIMRVDVIEKRFIFPSPYLLYCLCCLLFRDDPELDKLMKERVRWGDPMAHLVKVMQHNSYRSTLKMNVFDRF